MSAPEEPATPDRIQRTRELWEPLYGHALSDEDCRQINENLVGFFRVLIRWDEAKRAGEDKP